ncbi:hypothetical protein WICPIJ_008618 [Wickerhamomyces pijperi]|uniref:Uncharacterized protein n=1 Tax=Wickerhamomyces pijperi TaxID=599730 RepID=A0A9P8PXL8_WICPI|nr:hypothetical protein WICPIJ_008618 [Wickerhamomyces pijperi]
MSQKDTIIISELSRAQTLLLPPKIKSIIKEYEQTNSEQPVVSNWVELFGLGRLVIVFTSTEAASAVYSSIKTSDHYLSNSDQFSVNLSETILKRHKSQESLREPPSPLEGLNETGLYREPTPLLMKARSNSIDLTDLNIPNHDTNIKSNQTLTLLEPLQIPKKLSPIKTNFDSIDQLEQPRSDKQPSPMSPTITFERVEDV